ncbi:MAG: SPOR domain-containing protein [Flavobacteriales bacterium]
MSRARVSWSALRSVLLARKALLCLLLLAAARHGASQDQQGLTELRDRAETAYAEGRLLDALSDYERLVSLFPEEGCLHGRLAGCALREPGRLTLARRHLRIAVKLGCEEVDLEFHRARMAQLEYDFDRARDLYAAYVAAAGKKGVFREEALKAGEMCGAAIWDPSEAIGLEVLDRFPADPEGAFRFYRPETPGLRLVNTPQALRSKADGKVEPGRIAFHNGDTVLVYASLGKAGKTGWDLYRIALTGGQYGEAERLSDSINSPFDERGAYLSKDGVLYFSSNRPGGLGGHDIYAVPWGQDGPVGRPERLPFPVNSVNDDEFFIPEPDGGAWMSSNRAAREGRIHAYRVALSALPFDAGSVSWLADEVASEGMTLRVYSRGEEVVTRVLDGEGAEHEPLPMDAQAVGVRIVLEDEEGRIVSESFGAGESAWELRKQGRGWTMVERDDVDWAMLADLRRPEGEQAALVPAVASEEAETGQDDNASQSRQWGNWVRDRMMPPEEPEETSVMEAASLATLPARIDEDPETGFNDKPEAESTADSAEVVEDHEDVADVKEVEDAGGDPITEEVKDVEDAVGDPTAQVEETMVTDNVALEGVSPEEPVATAEEPVLRSVEDVLESGDAPTPEEMAAMLEEEPEALVRVWNEKATILLTREAGFLDSPSMSQAGMLSDLVEDLAEWQPEEGMMDERLQDGAAMEEVRDMIETWTYAVQSATKASLAEVAGDAALAYRREKLALREIREMSDVDVGNAIQGVSSWQESRRSLSADQELQPLPNDVQMSSWLVDWEEGMNQAESGWTRKARSGWRGDWLRRQRRHHDVVSEQWTLHMSELESQDAALTSESAEDEAAGPADLDFMAAPFGSTTVETMARFVLGRPMVEEEDADVEGATWDDVTLTNLLDSWTARIQSSKPIERGWERLVELAGGEGIPLVHQAEDLRVLSPEASKQLLDIKEDMLALLLESIQSERAVIEGADSFWSMAERREDMEGAPSVAEALTLREEWTDATDRVVERRKSAEKLNGEARFEAQKEWHNAMLELALVQQALLNAMAEAELDLERLVTSEEESLATREKAEEGQGIEDQQDGRLDLTEVADDDQEKGGLELERVEAERIEAERLEAERIETERLEAERLEAERIEAERLEAERLETERMETERVEAERLEAERLEAERIEGEWLEAERIEAERLEAERIEAERLEAERIEAERASAELDVADRVQPWGGADESVVREAFSGDLPAGWTWLEGAEVVESAAALQKEQRRSGTTLSWTPSELALIESWIRLRDASAGELDASAGRQARSQKEKALFFATRDLQDALTKVDLTTMQARVDARLEPSSDVVAREILEENEVNPTQPEVSEGLDRAERADVERSGVDEDAVSASGLALEEEVSNVYGVTLPAAEVVGEGRRSDSGIRLRPVQREEMERAIIGTWAEQPEAERISAAETYDEPAGRPREVGVEYKVQIGAFRNPLPAALFAAFDPMWAQRSASGITRYMAGSFDAYDPAVVARDAIRALGYSDAFVVRFVDGERVRGSRPAPEALAQERSDLAAVGRAPVSPSTSTSEVSAGTESVGATAGAIPTRREDIETWSDVQGRVYSVQVGAFRGVPDRRALSTLGTLTREDAGSDGWLRLFSGRFETEEEARAHLAALKQDGRTDAFVVVYINGRRIPLLQASTTATGGLDVVNRPVAPSRDEEPVESDSGVTSADDAGADQDSSVPQWRVELGEYTSTIPVRLANAILDAPLEWEVRSRRDGGVTRYITRFTEEEGQAERWLAEAKAMGFSRARLMTAE